MSVEIQTFARGDGTIHKVSAPELYADGVERLGVCHLDIAVTVECGATIAGEQRWFLFAPSFGFVGPRCPACFPVQS